jgi:hypothetical protein
MPPAAIKLDLIFKEHTDSCVRSSVPYELVQRKLKRITSLTRLNSHTAKFLERMLDETTAQVAMYLRACRISNQEAALAKLTIFPK